MQPLIHLPAPSPRFDGEKARVRGNSKNCRTNGKAQVLRFYGVKKIANDDITQGILEGLREAIAWKKRQIDLDIVHVHTMPLDQAEDLEQSPEAVEKAAHTA